MDKGGLDRQLRSSPRVSEETLARFVDRFYSNARNDPRLESVINRAIAGDWETLLGRMRSFWASAMRADEHYPGDPVSVHPRLEEIGVRLIKRWVELFDECVEVFDERLAASFRAWAARITETLKGALSLESARTRTRSAP